MSAHRDLSAMITHHAEMARRLGEQLGSRSETWTRWTRRTSSGTARAGPASCAATTSRSRRGWPPSASSPRSRTASGGVEAATALVRSARRQAVRPRPGRRVRRRTPTMLLVGPGRRRHLGRGDRRRTGPRRACWSATSSTRGCWRSPTSSTCKSPYIARPRPGRGRPGGGRRVEDGHVADRGPNVRRAGLVHGFGRLGVSNAILDKRDAARHGGAGASADAAVPDRADAAAVAGARVAGRDRGAAPRAARRLRIPTRPDGGGDLTLRAGAGGGGRLPVDARAAGAPGAALAAVEAAPGCEGRYARAGSTPDAVEAVLAGGRPPDVAPAAGPAGLTAREIDVLRLLAAWLHEQGHRRTPGDLTQDGGQPRRAHLQQDRRLQPRGRRVVRHAARAPRRGGARTV